MSETDFNPEEIARIIFLAQRLHGNVIVAIKSELKRSGSIGVEVTSPDLLERYARTKRLCYYKGLICVVPQPASRAMIEVGDGIELILRDGKLFAIDIGKYNEETKQ